MSAPQTITVAEENALLDTILKDDLDHPLKKKSVRNYAITLLMLDAGLRVGEVVTLVVKDLFFTSVPVKSIIFTDKTAEKESGREIPISTRLKEALKMLWQYFSTPFSESGDSPVFFTGDPPKPITTRQVERIIAKAAWDALGRPIHPHVLRHTFATKLMRVTDIRTVQELLGHKCITSTQVYTHPDLEDKKKAIDKALNEIRDDEGSQ